MKKTRVVAGLAAAALLPVLVLIIMYNLPLNFSDKSPLQPLVFSHKLHAGVDGISCLFCHRHAAEGPVAGVPSVETCVKTCHPHMGLKIPGLEAYWRNGKSIPWIKVHRMPDHVYFPHMMHIRAGLDCTACHGRVAAMEPLTRVASLKMGWCLDCHRAKKVSIDCWMCHK